jgi:hypothetical protein
VAYIRLEIVGFLQAGAQRPEPVFAIHSNDSCFRVVSKEPLGPRSNVKSTEVIHRKDDMNNGTPLASHNRRAALNNCMGKFAHSVQHQGTPKM